MKTPREKAEELISIYTEADYTDLSIHGTKSCAIIAVKLIIKSGPSYPVCKTALTTGTPPEWFDTEGKWAYVNQDKYWKQVKIELENYE